MDPANQNLQYFPSNGSLSDPHISPYWTSNCRRVLRKTKRVPAKSHKPKESLSLMTGLYETAAQKEEATLPLFMKETIPGEGTALILSPEKVLPEPKGKVCEPMNLAYVFGHHSVQNKRISYGSE